MLDLTKYQPQWVSIADINIEDTAFMFRKDLNAADLAASLKAEGQKFPVVIWRRPPSPKATDGQMLHIISGFRRVTAAKQLGWEKVMGVVIPEADLPMDEALRLNFLENMARKSLNNLDIMFACQKLSQQGKSNVEIGKLIGKSEAQVRRYIKVADAPADIQQKVGSGQTTLTDATDKATRRDDEFKNMYVKSTKNGFKVILNYNRKRDKIDEIKAFLSKVMAMLDNDASRPAQPKKPAKAATSPQRPETGNDKGKGGVGAGFSPRDVVADSSAFLKTEPADLSALKNLASDRQKGMLDQLTKMAQNPMTRPIVEQMAKASGCQNCEEFLEKIKNKA